MMRNIFIALFGTLLTATVVIILNRFIKKKVVLDNQYAIKAILLFILVVIVLSIMDKI